MGLEARCEGRHGRQHGEGRLQHEGAKILFRGAFKLDIAVKDLTKVTADGENLILTWGKGKATFTVGEIVATTWVHKILNPPCLLDKLGVKYGHTVGVGGVFDLSFIADLKIRVEPWNLQPGREYDVILLKVIAPADLPAIPHYLPLLAPAGVIWVVYPKGGVGIKEAEVRKAALAAGLVDNKTCAFSDTLTALRWVRPKASRSGPR
jgi:hypothetical protein